MRVFRNTNLNFGLINIPVEVYGTKKTSEVKFEVCSHDGMPLKRVYVRPDTREEVDGNNWRLYNGAVIDKTTIDAIKGEAKREGGEDLRQFNIEEFIPLAKVPFFRVTNWYYIAPAKGNAPSVARAYKALVAGMEQDGTAAVCKWVSTQRQDMMVIYPVNGVLNAVAVVMEDDVVEPDEETRERCAAKDVPVSDQEIAMARQLMDALLDPEAKALSTMSDTAVPALREMADAAAAGVTIEPMTVTTTSPTVVPDLMSALQASLDEIDAAKKKPAKRKKAAR